jgi:hypothetical protein
VAVAMFQIVPPCGLCHVAAGATLQPPAGAMLRPVPCCGRCPNTIVWSRDRSAGRSTITIGLFFREPHAAHAAGHSAQSRFCCSSGNRTLHTQPVNAQSRICLFSGIASCTCSQSPCTVTMAKSVWKNPLQMRQSRPVPHCGRCHFANASRCHSADSCRRPLPRTVSEGSIQKLCMQHAAVDPCLSMGYRSRALGLPPWSHGEPTH